MKKVLSGMIQSSLPEDTEYIQIVPAWLHQTKHN